MYVLNTSISSASTFHKWNDLIMGNPFVFRWIPEDLQTAGCVGYEMSLILVEVNQNKRPICWFLSSSLSLSLYSASSLKLKLHPNQVQWTPATQDIWGPSLTSLQGMLVKVSFYKISENILKSKPKIGCPLHYMQFVHYHRKQCHAYLVLFFKVESHEFKPFKDASEDYANK